MFKTGRWWSEKNKLKVVFKLQFHASQLTQVGGDGLMVSVVPGDSVKPTAKSDKAAVVDGTCLWENPVYETVKFNQDSKSGKVHERIYYFIVGTGISKSGVVGEASIDFSNYVEAKKVSLASLPLKNSKTQAILHVSIQRMQESMDQREVEESENAKISSKDDNYLRLQLCNQDVNGTIKQDTLTASSASDITISTSGSSSEIETPWELQMKNDDSHQEAKSEAPTPMYNDQRSSWEWLGNSAVEASTDDSSSTPREGFLNQQSEVEAPDTVIERLKSDLAAVSRQAEMSDLEMQTLRRQIVKESKRGQDLWREVVCLKEERESLKGECEKLRESQRWKDDAKARTSFRFDGVDTQAIVEELRQELNHAKEVNANLQIQLQKTQESNSELILAVRDLDEIVEQKNRQILNLSTRDADPAFRSEDDGDDDDEEQKALEELVKEHSNPKEAHLLEQQIMDLNNEIEIYRRDRDELETQMEQLALDYEIMKQANHDMSCKLEQCRIQEQLKMQDECSSSETTANDLENYIENMENELKRLSKDYEDSLLKISDLEAHAKGLEEELEKQAQGFEADLEALTCSKIEQEQRAIRAEETLKKMRWKNANTAERLQEEFRRLSVQMGSTFEANEKLASKAMAEANELRLQKNRLEKLLRINSEEYEIKLSELSSRVILVTNQIEEMQLEIEDKETKLEDQKKHAEDTQKLLSDEVSMLRDEIETLVAKNAILLEDMEGEKRLMHELKQMRMSIKELELTVEQGNDERVELESKIMLLKNEAGESNKMRSLLQSELDSLQSQCTDLKHSLLEAEAEKENLKKQVSQLRSDLKKKEEAINNMEKKIKDGSGRGTTLDPAKAASKTSKPVPRGPKEVANLKERIKLLESQIKLKETALETSSKAFQEKEKDLLNKIQELKETAENDELKIEIELLRKMNRSIEGDLNEVQERYSDISLKFAEVEGERQQLVMKLRNLNNASKSP